MALSYHPKVVVRGGDSVTRSIDSSSSDLCDTHVHVSIPVFLSSVSLFYSSLSAAGKVKVWMFVVKNDVNIWKHQLYIAIAVGFTLTGVMLTLYILGPLPYTLLLSLSLFTLYPHPKKGVKLIVIVTTLS